MYKNFYMNWKKLLILLVAFAIILAIVSVDILKSDVNLEVHGEKIPNTDNIYIVCKICDDKGNIVDTSIGMLSSEFQYESEDENSAGSVAVLLPLKNGKSIIRENEQPCSINIKYDGGYFYNPCEYSGKLIVKNSTNLTDDDLTPPY